MGIQVKVPWKVQNTEWRARILQSTTGIPTKAFPRSPLTARNLNARNLNAQNLNRELVCVWGLPFMDGGLVLPPLSRSLNSIETNCTKQISTSASTSTVDTRYRSVKFVVRNFFQLGTGQTRPYTRRVLDACSAILLRTSTARTRNAR